MQKNIHINKWINWLLFLPFLQPGEYIIGNSMNVVISVFQCVSFVTITVLYIIRGKLSTCLLLIGLIQVSFFFSTLANPMQMNLFSVAAQAASIMSVCMLIELNIESNATEFLGIIYAYSIMLLIIHAITMYYFFPYGMYIDVRNDTNYYFLGHDNASFFHFFPIILFGVIYSLIKKNKIGWEIWGSIMLVGGAYFYVNSATASAILAALWVILLFHKTKILKIINYRTCILLCLCSFKLIVFLQIQVYFSDFIQDVLNKNITFSGRTYVWKRGIEYIKQSPLIGYGMELYSVSVQKIGADHMHNIVFDFLYRGGVLSFSLFIMLVLACYRPMMEKKHMLSTLVSCFFCCYFMLSMFDYYNNKCLVYAIYIIMYYMPSLIDQYEKAHLQYIHNDPHRKLPA